jgi:predicted aminopeptidase
MGARDAAAMVADPATPDDTRQFLLRIRQIKAFAVEHVGLRDSASYTRYKDLGRDHLVDVVQACDAASFTGYLWSYPFLGKLPYKGFYDRADAEAEAARLKSEGFDTIIRPVDAFSTLGFLKDPLYSFMKKYSTFQIASLVIHEQTHATLFVKGQPDFNEELATFVGDEGAFEWMRVRFGEDSPEYRGAQDEYSDGQEFTALLAALSARLEPVYSEAIPREQKLIRKASLISEFQADLASKAATLFRTKPYSTLGALPVNNALLSLYRLYSNDVPLLRSYWEQRCGSDLKRFITAAVALAKTGDVKAQMRAALDAP